MIRGARPRLDLLVPCALAVVVYVSLIKAPFLSWDDTGHIAGNPYYQYLGWWRLWFHPYFGMYVPVISTVWAALYHLGNAAPWPFRVYNLVVHVVNVVLVWRLLSTWFERRDVPPQRARPAVAVGATVFALHPLQTGAVAWISGARDLTTTLLALVAVALVMRESRWAFAGATVLFGMSLLSKPSAAALPLALAAHDALLEPDRFRRTGLRMVLWSLLVVAVAVTTSFIQGEMVRLSVPLSWRPLVAMDALAFYALKTAWPAGLSADHGRTPEYLRTHPGLLLATVTAVALAAACALTLRRERAVNAWLLIWAVLLLPVLGLTTFAYQRISTVADHYMYLPMVAVAGLAASAVVRFVKNPVVARGAWVAVALVMTPLSMARTRVWQSDDALFRDALATNPRSFPALTNLSKTACKDGDVDWGLRLADSSLSVMPGEAAALANRAYCLFDARRAGEIIAMVPQLGDSVTQFSLDHNDVAAASLANAIAGAFFARDEPQRAWPFLCQALALQPNDPNYRRNVTDMSRDFGDRPVPECTRRLAWAELAKR